MEVMRVAKAPVGDACWNDVTDGDDAWTVAMSRCRGDELNAERTAKRSIDLNEQRTRCFLHRFCTPPTKSINQSNQPINQINQSNQPIKSTNQINQSIKSTNQSNRKNVYSASYLVENGHGRRSYFNILF